MSLSYFNVLLKKTILIHLTCLSLLFGLAKASEATKPESNDYLSASSILGVAVGLELFAKDLLLPEESRFSKPLAFDVQLRNKLYWGKQHQERAREWSDHLIYGVSLSSLVWGPLLANDPEVSALINAEVFAINSIITNLVKIGVGRERPYQYFGSRPSRGRVDNASFFSGHSSVAFSQAVSNALILSQDYSQYSNLIWSSLLTTAGLTAYLRVAGDMHYVSDVLVGALVGSAIGWSVTQLELARFGKNDDAQINFMLSFKIPLG